MPRAHLTNVKQLQFQSHKNALAITEAEAVQALQVQNAGRLDRKLNQLQLSVEEYISFLELECERNKSDSFENKLNSFEHEARAELLTHNLECARNKLDTLLRLARGDELQTSTSSSSSHFLKDSGGAIRSPNLLVDSRRSAIESQQPISAARPGDGHESRDETSRTLTWFKEEQLTLERMCFALKKTLENEEEEEEEEEDMRENDRDRARDKNQLLVEMFRALASLESRLFEQHESVSRHYDRLLENYVFMLDDLQNMKRKIKRMVGVI